MVSLLALPILCALQAPAALPMNAELWTEDLDYLEKTLPTSQLNFEKLMPLDTWRKQFVDLRKDLPSLSDSVIKLRIGAIVASLRVAHTRLSLDSSQFAAYPFRASAWDDGIFVFATTPQTEDLVGAKILAIDGVPSDKIAERLGKLEPSDNKYWPRTKIAQWAHVSDALFAVGIAKKPTEAKFTFQLKSGKKIDRVLRTEGTPSTVKSMFATDTLPTFLRRQTENYKARFYPEQKLMVIDFRRCAQESNRWFKDFLAEAMETFDKGEYRAIAVDLRMNGGGNSIVLYPFLALLKQRPELARSNRLFALTSVNTFSSAMMNANELRQAGATLIGEPTGGSPNSYGEQKIITLPNSKLSMTYCTRYFGLVADRNADTIQPDWAVPLRWADISQGKDAWLDLLFKKLDETGSRRLTH